MTDKMGEVDFLIGQALQENQKLMQDLLLYKSIVEKKDFEYMTMSDKEKLEARIMKKRGAL